MHLGFSHRVAGTRDADMIPGHVYVLEDSDGQVRYMYVGHTKNTKETVQERMRKHALHARSDPTPTPLYRLIASTGGIDGWSIRGIRKLGCLVALLAAECADSKVRF
jgi:hypothetical protein